MSSHLPPCRSSDVSSEHIHTFQVAQKLPQCPSPHGPGACCPPRRYWRSGRSGAAARSGEPRLSGVLAGLAEALLSIRAVSLLLSEGKAKLAASGPQGCDQASAAPALPAGPKRRASSQRAVRLGWSARPSRAPSVPPPGPGKTGAGPASRLDPVPSCPSPPLQPSPVAPPQSPAWTRGPRLCFGTFRPVRHGCLAG